MFQKSLVETFFYKNLTMSNLKNWYFIKYLASRFWKDATHISGFVWTSKWGTWHLFLHQFGDFSEFGEVPQILQFFWNKTTVWGIHAGTFKVMSPNLCKFWRKPLIWGIIIKANIFAKNSPISFGLGRHGIFLKQRH